MNETKNPVIKVKLSTTTSLKALEAAGRRAEAKAIAERTQEASKPEAPRSQAAKKAERKQRPQLKPIERSMKAITRAVESHDFGSRIAEFTKLPKYSTAYAQLTVYSDGSKRVKDYVYVFYCSYIRPDKLGSAAIYGQNLDEIRAEILRTGSVLGQPVKTVKVSMGLRPFLDVTLR